MGGDLWKVAGPIGSQADLESQPISGEGGDLATHGMMAGAMRHTADSSTCVLDARVITSVQCVLAESRPKRVAGVGRQRQRRSHRGGRPCTGGHLELYCDICLWSHCHLVIKKRMYVIILLMVMIVTVHYRRDGLRSLGSLYRGEESGTGRCRHPVSYLKKRLCGGRAPPTLRRRIYVKGKVLSVTTRLLRVYRGL